MLYQQNYRFKVVRLWDSKGSGSSKLQWSFETSRLEMKKRDIYLWFTNKLTHSACADIISLYCKTKGKNFGLVFILLNDSTHKQPPIVRIICVCLKPIFLLLHSMTM